MAVPLELPAYLPEVSGEEDEEGGREGGRWSVVRGGELRSTPSPAVS